jgi:hypothetical protein
MVGQAFLNTLTAGRQEDCLVRQLFNAVSSFENRMQSMEENVDALRKVVEAQETMIEVWIS